MKLEEIQFSEADINDVSINLDRLTTLTKLLNQSLVEPSIYSDADSQNLCSMVRDELEKTKSKFGEIERAFYL